MSAGPVGVQRRGASLRTVESGPDACEWNLGGRARLVGLGGGQGRMKLRALEAEEDVPMK